MKTIASAFVRAKRKFGPALKDKTNPAFRSKYADLGACIDAVEDALLAEGIALYQETFHDEAGVTLETVMLHESGESLRCGKLHVPASKRDPQGFGSALTYARRYSLMAACGIAAEDDDGNAAVKAMKHRPKGGVIVEKPAMSICEKVAEAINEHMAKGDVMGAFEECQGITDSEEKTYLWSLLPSATRSAIKKYSETIKEAA